MKTYPIICPSCQGIGHVRQSTMSTVTNSALDMTCPACSGNKWVICSETDSNTVRFESRQGEV